MKNHWLERAEAKAMTMEQKIEKMLAPHHVIWLADDTVGKTGTVVPETFFVGGNIPSHITITDEIPASITVTWGPPQMAEWDFNMTVQANPHSDLSHTFDLNTMMSEMKTEIESAVEAEFARLVESEGWNLDL